MQDDYDMPLLEWMEQEYQEILQDRVCGRGFAEEEPAEPQPTYYIETNNT